MEQIIAKAAGMIEALPFIQRFRNETVVVKLKLLHYFKEM